ncbi:hypothetical protein PMIN04_006339 [Paraphaeosphaeria minitans]
MARLACVAPARRLRELVSMNRLMLDPASPGHSHLAAPHVCSFRRETQEYHWATPAVSLFTRRLQSMASIWACAELVVFEMAGLLPLIVTPQRRASAAQCDTKLQHPSPHG